MWMMLILQTHKNSFHYSFHYRFLIFKVVNKVACIMGSDISSFRILIWSFCISSGILYILALSLVLIQSYNNILICLLYNYSPARRCELMTVND